MGGTTIGTSLNFGFPGTVSRTMPQPVIENKVVKSNSANIGFGIAVVLNTDNTVSSPESVVLTAANFAGVAAAVTKQQNAYPPNDLNGEYTALEPCDIIQQGIVSVLCQKGTPTAGGAVYARIVASTEFPLLEIGGFEAEADGSQTVALTNCVWNTNVKDANGVAELKIRLINN